MIDQRQLALLAHLGAQRAILVQLLVLQLLQEPDPVGRATLLRDLLRQRGVVPPASGTDLDPATSDLLAAMTEEEIERIMEQVIGHLACRTAA